MSDIGFDGIVAVLVAVAMGVAAAIGVAVSLTRHSLGRGNGPFWQGPAIYGILAWVLYQGGENGWILDRATADLVALPVAILGIAGWMMAARAVRLREQDEKEA